MDGIDLDGSVDLRCDDKVNQSFEFEMVATSRGGEVIKDGEGVKER